MISYKVGMNAYMSGDLMVIFCTLAPLTNYNPGPDQLADLVSLLACNKTHLK